MNNRSKTFLTEFIQEFQDLYGLIQVTFNIHNLIHLPNKVISFSCSLDKFSCFPFENSLKDLRNEIQNSPKPVQQLVNRITEETKFPEKPLVQKLYPTVRYSKSLKITKIEFENFSVSVDEMVIT